MQIEDHASAVIGESARFSDISVHDITTATHAANAQVSEDAAAISETNAGDAAAGAVFNRDVTAMILGSESFTNPIFANWGNTWPDGTTSVNELSGSVTKSTSGKYGNAIDLVTAANPIINQPNMKFRSTEADLIIRDSGDADSNVGLALICEFENRAGTWDNGGGIQVHWVSGGTGGTDATAEYLFDDYRNSAQQFEDVVMDVVAIKPDAYVAGSAAGYIDIIFFATSNINGKTRAEATWRIHRLSVRDLSANSESTLTQTALSDIAGNSEASFVMRAKAGEAVGTMETVATNNAATGIAESQITLQADDIIFKGDVLVGGDIKSEGFVTGVTGMHFDLENDTLEIQNLIARTAIIDGAVSDGGIYSSYSAPAHLDDNTSLGSFTLGAFTTGSFWHLAYSCNIRHHSQSYGTYVPKTNQTPKTIMGTRVRFQYRTKTSGSWNSWVLLVQSAKSNSASTWRTVNGVFDLQGVYEDVQIRVLVEEDLYSFADVTGNFSGNTNYNNIDNNSYVARALVR